MTMASLRAVVASLEETASAAGPVVLPALGPVCRPWGDAGCDPPRCVTALQLDGGTRLCRDFALEFLTQEITDVLTEARRRRSRQEEDRERELGGRVARLPMPQLGLFTQDPLAKVEVLGDRRQIIRFYIPDVVHITWYLEGQGKDTTPKVRCEFKAKTLWSPTAEQEVAWWLSVISWWCGDPLHDLVEAMKYGWHVTGIELCSDFVAMEWKPTDFSSWAKPPNTKVGAHYRLMGDRGSRVETVECGKRTGNVSWCLYLKTEQVIAVKGGDASTYEHRWKAGGWRGERIARAELRVSKRGLRLVEVDTGEVHDFTDPARLFDRDELKLLWARASRSHRLVDRESATRVARCRNDPRWDAVQAAVDFVPPHTVQDREGMVDTVKERAHTVRKQLFRKLVQYASLHYLEGRGEDGMVATLRLALWEAQEEDLELWELLGEYGDRYTETHVPFAGREMLEAGRKILDRYGRRVDGDVVLRPASNLPAPAWWEKSRGPPGEKGKEATCS